ncbi:MAG: hypothetical protein M3R66_01750 [Actinomycetota bacterium]|nr:hypothetical protein [Actinomycetota bacterium]
MGKILPPVMGMTLEHSYDGKVRRRALRRLPRLPLPLSDFVDQAKDSGFGDVLRTVRRGDTVPLD